MTTIRRAATAASAAAQQGTVSVSGGAIRTALPAICAGALVALAFSGLAVAQQAPSSSTTTPTPTSTGAQPTSLQEVTVTGSRIKRTTDFNTPTPTTVIDASTMNSLGIINVGQALQLSPANISDFTPANTGNANFFTGSYIADLRGLNPYFGSRTLTLIDSRRVVQTDQGDSFDLNFIPQILVQRIDTVTGGASAAYGSGAIAGVINVILNRQLEGAKIDADFFQTSHSDARDRHVGAAWGHGFFDNRIHLVVGGEYENQDALGCQQARSWCAQNAGLYPTSVSSSNVTAYGYGSGLRINQISMSGVFTGVGPNANVPTGLQSNADGTNVIPYGSGQIQYLGQPASDAVIGGDGEPTNEFTNLMAPVNRGVITGLLTAQITDNISFQLGLNWGKVETTDYNQALTDNNEDLSYQNAFLTPGLVQGLGLATSPTSGGAPLLAINKDWTSQVHSLTRFTTSLQRVSAGFNGKFGDTSWTWDVFGEYGLTRRSQLVQDNRRLMSYYMALDSVKNPITGQPECRVSAFGGNPAAALFAPPPPPGTVGVGGATSVPGYFPLYGLGLASPTLSLLASDCVPINPFGTGPISQAAYQYSFGNLDERLRYEQTYGDIDFSGNYFRGIGAGPFALAAGYEWRQEVGNNDENPCRAGVSAAQCQAENDDFLIQYGEPFGGGVTVNEEYLETNLPLAKHLPFANDLEVDLAGRESQYDNRATYGIDVVNGNRPEFTHDLLTWKASLIWDPVAGVRLRATQSHDARAANFRELYYGQIFTPGGFFGYCNGDFGDPCHWNLEGNVDLKPETSNTTTIGIVLTPKNLVNGLQFSADWFHIKLTNAIEQANIQAVWTGCRAGVPSDCALMQFNNTLYQSSAGPGFNAPCANQVNCGGLPFYSGATAWQGGVDNGTSTTAQSYNGAFYEVKGIDFSFNYLVDLGAGGTLNTRILTTWYDEQKFQGISTAPTFNILGQTGTGNNFLNDYNPNPKWRGSVLITWAKGGLTLTPSMNFVGHGIQDYVGVTPANATLYNEVYNGNPAILGYGLHLLPSNYVPSYFLFNFNATYSFQQLGPIQGLQLFAQINNVLNKTPPVTFGGGGFGPNSGIGGTNPIFFDTLGLAYRVGFRAMF